MNKEFIKFILVGSIAALCNFSVRIIFDHFFSFTVSIVFAYLIGMLIAFILNKIFVFKATINSISKQIYYFILINILGILQTLFISILLADYIFPNIGIINYSKEIAHFIGISFPLLTSFIGHKFLSFKIIQKNDIKYFYELNANYKDYIILLDIDGTLTYDNETIFSQKIIDKILEFKKFNTIYLCSNSNNFTRIKKIENILKLDLINSKYRKPNKEIIRSIPIGKKIIVIGDKFLTDYIFATKIKADVILVKRLINGNEKLFIKITNKIDDFIYFIYKLFFNNSI
ncbi:hypothetical protein A2272_00525 [Candidatus Peregrinibacteria bacterium RIFOXYA12_FULL_33_12]|nr:MAG: hypothetical protein A2272_00525 [Candidatus Peregrinibacteria bacterium RIFOXYA12_FULL_33_12]